MIKVLGAVFGLEFNLRIFFKSQSWILASWERYKSSQLLCMTTGKLPKKKVTP